MKSIIATLLCLISLNAFSADYQVEFLPAAGSVGASEVSSIPASKVSGLDTAVNNILPAGVVVAYAGSSCPSGWIKADGSAVSRTGKSRLFTALGITHGQGDGSTTFNLPDYRGRFLRGVDSGIGRDPDRASRTASGTGGNTGDQVGSVQNYAIENIVGTWNGGFRVGYGIAHVSSTGVFTNNGTATAENNGAGGAATANANIKFDASRVVSTSSETRPANINVNYCIKE